MRREITIELSTTKMKKKDKVNFKNGLSNMICEFRIVLKIGYNQKRGQNINNQFFFQKKNKMLTKM